VGVTMKWLSRITGTIWLFIGLLAAFLAYEAYEFGYVRFNYLSMQEYPVQGLDISHHQGEVDWESLEQEPYQFVYIKATEGGDHVDSRFAENWKQAQAIGLVTGAYHFFTFCKSGKEQAKNFTGTVPKTASMLPPAIDLEFAGNCKHRPSRQELLKELGEFEHLLEAFYGRKPIIYSTKRAYRAFLENEELHGTHIWMRDMLKEPVLPDGREWLFWQYASNARVKGFSGVVDLNVFKGSEKDFRLFVDASSEP